MTPARLRLIASLLCLAAVFAPLRAALPGEARGGDEWALELDLRLAADEEERALLTRALSDLRAEYPQALVRVVSEELAGRLEFELIEEGPEAGLRASHALGPGRLLWVLLGALTFALGRRRERARAEPRST